MIQHVRYAIIVSADRTNASTMPSQSAEAPINVPEPASVPARSVPPTARLRPFLLPKGREHPPAFQTLKKMVPRIADPSIRPPSEPPISNRTDTFASNSLPYLHRGPNFPLLQPPEACPPTLMPPYVPPTSMCSHLPYLLTRSTPTAISSTRFAYLLRPPFSTAERNGGTTSSTVTLPTANNRTSLLFCRNPSHLVAL